MPFDQDTDGVTATLRYGGDHEVVRGGYLVGCEGAYSAVSDGLRWALEGCDYGRTFMVTASAWFIGCVVV